MGFVKQCGDTWLKLCLCSEMGGHDRAFEYKNTMGQYHILPGPHPSNIDLFMDWKGLKNKDMFLMRIIQWVHPELVNTVQTTATTYKVYCNTSSGKVRVLLFSTDTH